MEWDARIAKWDLAYEHAAAYAKANGDLLPSATYRSEDGFGLGDWVRRMRTAARKMTEADRGPHPAVWMPSA